MGTKPKTKCQESVPSPEQIITGFDDTFKIDPRCKRRYLLHNRTPYRIRIAHAGLGEIVVAPLAQRVVKGSRLAPFEDDLRRFRQRHQLRVREYDEPKKCSGPTCVVAVAAIVVAALTAVIAIHDILQVGTLMRRGVVVPATITVALVAVWLLLATRDERRRHRGETVADTDEGDIEFGVGGSFYDGSDSLRRTKQMITLLGVIAIGAVLPAIAIFVATDAKDFLVMEGGLRVVDGTESRLVGRIIQVLYTATLSLFPAILYFQFDRHRIGTIRSEWVRSIFRMDRRMKTLADVNAQYGDELSEASNYSADSVRVLGGKNSPIIIATLLITLGWTLLVVRTDSFDFSGASAATASAETAEAAAARASAAADAVERGTIDRSVGEAVAASASEQAAAALEDTARVSAESRGEATPEGAPADAAGTVEQDSASATAAAGSAAVTARQLDKPYFEFLVPTPSAATMAFLGAYFFGMYLLLRSFFRGDLRPKIYNQITARLITVVVLAYLINVLFYETGATNTAVLAVAFMAGVVPTAVLRQVSHLASAILKTRPKNPFDTPRELTQIDGLDMYESARLETEGITDVPSLALSDLVSVMVKTRMPIARLIDWKDQALLILLLDDDASEGVDNRVKQLRRIGIRTASAAVAVADDPAAADQRTIADEILAAPKEGRGTTLAALAATIRREPAMAPIRQWRWSDLGAADTRCRVLTMDSDLPRPDDLAA